MSPPLDRYRPETTAGMAFAFAALFLVVLPVVVVLSVHAPWALGLGAVLLFLGWVAERTGVLPGTDRSRTEVDPLGRLQDQYAAGEIDDVEFERRLERLAETGAFDRERAESGRMGDRDGAGLDRALERDRER